MIPGFARQHWHGVLLLLVLAALYLPWTWSDDLGDPGGDSAVYVLTARAFSPYADADRAAHLVAANSQFPPLYPLLLAVSGGAHDVRLAHAVTTLALIAAFGGLYFWLLTLGVPAALAVAGVGAFALLPGTRIQALFLHSETLYLCGVLWALAALAGAMRRGTVPLYWFASAAVAAALLTRTAGLALLPALAVALWRGRPRGWPLMLGAAIVPALAWNVAHRQGNGYASAMVAEYGSAGLAELARRILQNIGAVIDGLFENWVQTMALDHVVALLLLAAAAAAAVRFWRLEPDAWYVAAYVAILAIWPYPAERVRFAWVLCPFLIGYLLSGMVTLQEWMGPRLTLPRGLLPALLVFGLALLLVPGVYLTVQRYRHPLAEAYPELRPLPAWYGPDLRRSLRDAHQQVGLAAALRTLGRHVPADDCVLSIKPALVMFHAEHISVLPPPSVAPPVEFERQLLATSCRYALLLPFRSSTFTDVYYPAARLTGAARVAEHLIWKEDGREHKAVLVVFGEPRS
jgi:hypothetical protein